jgi:hypothetical protein
MPWEYEGYSISRRTTLAIAGPQAKAGTCSTQVAKSQLPLIQIHCFSVILVIHMTMRVPRISDLLQ